MTWIYHNSSRKTKLKIYCNLGHFHQQRNVRELWFVQIINGPGEVHTHTLSVWGGYPKCMRAKLKAGTSFSIGEQLNCCESNLLLKLLWKTINGSFNKWVLYLMRSAFWLRLQQLLRNSYRKHNRTRPASGTPSVPFYLC